MGLSQIQRMKLVAKLSSDLAMTAGEYLQLSDLIDDAMWRQDSATLDSNLTPWPDADELADLTDRARMRNNKKA